ncbi:hypothetical protein [Streptomyces sp. NPDC054787]
MRHDAMQLACDPQRFLDNGTFGVAGGVVRFPGPAGARGVSGRPAAAQDQPDHGGDTGCPLQVSAGVTTASPVSTAAAEAASAAANPGREHGEGGHNEEGPGR